MSHPEDSPRLSFVPEEDLELGQRYSGQVTAVVNGYWAVHPERVQLNSWDEKTKWGDCKCRQYTGPRPIDQIWIPEVIPPNSSSD